MLKEIKPGIYWTGAVDWEIRKIHGEEYSTHRGTSYNSYLIKDTKTVLIDTVWSPFASEFVENLDKEVGLNAVDAVIANHAEADHGGALAELMARIPGRPIYCTASGVNCCAGIIIKTGISCRSRRETRSISGAASSCSSKRPCFIGRTACSPT